MQHRVDGAVQVTLQVVDDVGEALQREFHRVPHARDVGADRRQIDRAPRGGVQLLSDSLRRQEQERVHKLSSVRLLDFDEHFLLDALRDFTVNVITGGDRKGLHRLHRSIHHEHHGSVRRSSFYRNSRRSVVPLADQVGVGNKDKLAHILLCQLRLVHFHVVPIELGRNGDKDAVDRTLLQHLFIDLLHVDTGEFHT